MASKAEYGVWYRLTKSTHVTQKQCSGEMGPLHKSFVQEMNSSWGFLSAYGTISQVDCQHPGPPLCYFFSHCPPCCFK